MSQSVSPVHYVMLINADWQYLLVVVDTFNRGVFCKQQAKLHGPTFANVNVSYIQSKILHGQSTVSIQTASKKRLDSDAGCCKFANCDESDKEWKDSLRRPDAIWIGVAMYPLSHSSCVHEVPKFNINLPNITNPYEKLSLEYLFQFSVFPV